MSDWTFAVFISKHTHFERNVFSLQFDLLIRSIDYSISYGTNEHIGILNMKSFFSGFFFFVRDLVTLTSDDVSPIMIYLLSKWISHKRPCSIRNFKYCLHFGSKKIFCKRPFVDAKYVKVILAHISCGNNFNFQRNFFVI